MLTHLSVSCDPVRVVRLVCLSPASVSCVYLVRLSRASRASVSCVCLVRLSRASCLFCSSCSSLLIRPPEHFDPFDPFRIFQAFNSYYPLSNSSGSIGSIRLPLHALQRVKINFFKRKGKPEGFEVFNSV